MRYRRLSTTPSRAEFISGLTYNCFVNKDLIGEKPAETTFCNIVLGIRPLPLCDSFISLICSFLVGLSTWKSRHHNDNVLRVTDDMTSSILTAWRRAVWWDRFGNPTIRFRIDDWTLSMNFCCPGLSLNIFRWYKRDGNPMVFHKCTLISVASPGYEQPTEAKAYMAQRDFSGRRWIPLTKASDAELWCFLWSAPEQTVKWTIETPVSWDAIAFITTSL